MQELESRERSLSSALRAVAEDEGTRGASAAVEARLRAEVRALSRARRLRTYATLVAVAAVVLVAVVVPGWYTTAPQPFSEGTSAEPGADGSTGEMATAFFPLIYVSVPMSDAQIVRLEVPQAALAPFGVPTANLLDEARPGRVLADVLVGEDGLARAVRFVSPSTNIAQQEQQP